MIRMCKVCHNLQLFQLFCICHPMYNWCTYIKHCKKQYFHQGYDCVKMVSEWFFTDLCVGKIQHEKKLDTTSYQDCFYAVRMVMWNKLLIKIQRTEGLYCLPHSYGTYYELPRFVVWVFSTTNCLIVGSMDWTTKYVFYYYGLSAMLCFVSMWDALLLPLFKTHTQRKPSCIVNFKCESKIPCFAFPFYFMVKHKTKPFMFLPWHEWVISPVKCLLQYTKITAKGKNGKCSDKKIKLNLFLSFLHCKMAQMWVRTRFIKPSCSSEFHKAE